MSTFLGLMLLLLATTTSPPFENNASRELSNLPRTKYKYRYSCKHKTSQKVSVTTMNSIQGYTQTFQKYTDYI